MLVTGVQPAGAGTLGAVQVAAVDAGDLARVARASEESRDRSPEARSDPPQPIVFPRDGLPVDQRPLPQRLQQAADRYGRDGGEGQGGESGDRDGDGRPRERAA